MGRLLLLKEVTINNVIQADRWLIPTRHGRSNEDSLFSIGLRRDSGEQRGPNAAPVTSAANKEILPVNSCSAPRRVASKTGGSKNHSAISARKCGSAPNLSHKIPASVLISSCSALSNSAGSEISLVIKAASAIVPE